MRSPLVVGNWKMYGCTDDVRSLLEGLCKEELPAKAGVAVCPPFPYIGFAQALLADTGIAWGAQNLCANSAAEGAFTGEVSASMLVDMKCRYVIVGHSERRTYYHDTDDLVAEKFINAQSTGLEPILCVGENLEQREAGETLAFVEQQILAVLDKVGIEAFEKAVIAYEPIWAIGTGRTASPEQAQEVHAHIRSVLAKKDELIADNMSLLYGGSVKAENAAQLFAKPDIDGALVGGASLKAADFAAICRAAE